MRHPNTTLIPFSDEWEQYMLTRPIEEVVALFKQCGNENLRLIGNGTVKNEEVEKAAERIRAEREKSGESYNFWAKNGMSFRKNGDTSVAFKDGFIQGAQFAYSHPDTAQLNFPSDKGEQINWFLANVLRLFGKDQLQIICREVADRCELKISDPAHLVAFGELVLTETMRELPEQSYELHLLKSRLQQMAEEFKGGEG